MTNKKIADAFRELGQLMELHDENAFKIRSYQNAYRNLRQLSQPLEEMSQAEIGQLKGVGKAISEKIRELVEMGQMAALEKYRAQTPPGVREMLQVKGFGPKKVAAVWQELGVESIGELLYAINENRLIELKGFGKKTQDDLKAKLQYYQRSQGQYHYARLEAEAAELLEQWRGQFPDLDMERTGPLRRCANVLDRMDFLMGAAQPSQTPRGVDWAEKNETQWMGTSEAGTPVCLHFCEAHSFGAAWFRTTGSEPFLAAFRAQFSPGQWEGAPTEAAIFEQCMLPWIAPELREQAWALDRALEKSLPELVTDADLKGVVHAHSNYSDGLHTVREMAEAARDLGYQYLVMTDHSKSAFYANGLTVDRVVQQMEEIDQLNQELAPFRIFKSIESDILADGRLDYPEDVLEQFDLIIASVHSNLRMDKEKATRRLVTAIENPYTRILGHPTGRLLLSREGYPIDYRSVIDACAQHGVVIELNANPYRLDLDWSWIPYALEKDVLISINPDAHSIAGIRDMHYGVCSARKGMLDAAHCLNAKNLEAFSAWVNAS